MIKNEMNVDELICSFRNDFGNLEKQGMKIIGVFGTPQLDCNDTFSIGIGEQKEVGEVSPWSYHISVSHPFVFDNRKLPNFYKGFRVQNVMTAKDNYTGENKANELPGEFKIDRNNEFIPHDEYWAPEKFIAFVERCEDEIRKKLDDPSMTKKEMLDALAWGDFEKHKMQCKKWRIKRLTNNF